MIKIELEKSCKPIVGALHGNNILCRACWQRELSYRRERNRTLGEFARFDLPAWADAKVYGASDTYFPQGER